MARYILLSAVLTLACGAGQTKMPTVRVDDVHGVLERFPPYRRTLSDEPFQKRFDRYLSWLADLKTPDALYLTELVSQGVQALDVRSDLFHEMVELQSWVQLGHRFDDVMNVEYYQQHYEAVYPHAHCYAVIQETALLNHFAEQENIGAVPALAYALVAPAYERRPRLKDADVPFLARKLRFNRRLFEADVTPDDVRRAIRIFEIGGYAYRDRQRVVERALEFVRLSPSERQERLRVPSLRDCPGAPR